MKAHPSIGLLLLTTSSYAATEIQLIDDFSQSDLENWQAETFSGTTQYRQTHYQGRNALHASSNSSASGLIFKTSIDINRTPWLNWEWNIPQPLPPHTEQTRSGDDFVARIYVIYSDHWKFWKTRSLSYVWSSSAGINAHWANPYTRQAHMWVVRSGITDSGKWIHEKRNVKQDFEQAFGEKINKIQAIAIMTDTDNTKHSTQAYYGKIYFTAD